MRRMISQKLVEWLKSIKSHVVQNEDITEIGGDLEVDGNIKINALENIVDKDGHSIGKDVEDALNGTNVIDVVFTEEDYVEETDTYAKHINVNNCFINVSVISQPQHEGAYFDILCPNFKGVVKKAQDTAIDSFSGLSFEPEDRDIIVLTHCNLAVFNGVVFEINDAI